MKENSHTDKAGEAARAVWFVLFFPPNHLSHISSINTQLQINISFPGHGGFEKQHLKPHQSVGVNVKVQHKARGGGTMRKG